MINLIPKILAAGTTEVNIEQEVSNPQFFGFNCIAGIIKNVVETSFIVAAIVTFVFLVWGGIDWLTSSGDKVKVDAAQKRITNALIGLTIVAASWAFYKLILTFLGIDLSKICTDNPIG